MYFLFQVKCRSCTCLQGTGLTGTKSNSVFSRRTTSLLIQLVGNLPFINLITSLYRKRKSFIKSISYFRWVKEINHFLNGRYSCTLMLVFFLLTSYFSGTIFSITVFSKYLQWHDSMLGIISTVSKISASFVYAFAPNETIFFIGKLVNPYIIFHRPQRT